VRAPHALGPSWTLVATVGGQHAAWAEVRGGVTLVRFDQRVVVLHLHAGSMYPGGHHWPYGDHVGGSELHRLIAAFNGGFKFNTSGNGFEVNGRTAVPLTQGLGSIVTYRDGRTAIGTWGEEIPSAGPGVSSVRQNLRLLVDQGVVSHEASHCPLFCWGKTVGGNVVTARSALGITAHGDLVWAAGEAVDPQSLGQALVSVGVVRAVQLDINPGWVAGYLYVHHPSGPHADPLLAGQTNLPGQLLRPYSRDFFAVVAR
jgi:hypothetical protein